MSRRSVPGHARRNGTRQTESDDTHPQDRPRYHAVAVDATPAAVVLTELERATTEAAVGGADMHRGRATAERHDRIGETTTFTIARW